MTGLMLYINLEDAWDTIMQEHIVQIVSRTFRKKTSKEYKKEVPRGFEEGGHKNFIT